MTAEKFDFKTRTYKTYALPRGAVLDAKYTDKIRCAECGKMLHYRDSYTSMRIHNAWGLGFAICEACMLQELQDRRDAWIKNQNEEGR